MSKLYKATAAMGVSTIVAMAVGVFRAKILALTLGPSGIGIFSQAMTFFQTAEALCGLGISLGVTKYVSEMWQSGRAGEVRNIVFSSVFLQSAAFFIFFAGITAFSKRLSEFLFSDPEYAPFLVMISAGGRFFVFPP